MSAGDHLHDDNNDDYENVGDDDFDDDTGVDDDTDDDQDDDAGDDDDDDIDDDTGDDGDAQARSGGGPGSPLCDDGHSLVRSSDDHDDDYNNILVTFINCLNIN